MSHNAESVAAEGTTTDQRRVACKDISRLMKRYYDATLGWVALTPEEEEALDRMVTAWWAPTVMLPRPSSRPDGSKRTSSNPRRETMDLRNPATWEKVAEAIGNHPYEYDLSDTSERLDVVQIVLTTLDRVINDEPGSAATSWTERT